MSTTEEISLDELNSIMNLQRQEAFDDNTEALHKTISKRGTLVTRHQNRSDTEAAKVSAEEQLLKIISNQSQNNAKPTSLNSSGPKTSTQVTSRSRSSSRVRSSSRPNHPTTTRRSSNRRPESSAGTASHAMNASMGNLGKKTSNREYRAGQSKRDNFVRAKSVGSFQPSGEIQENQRPLKDVRRSRRPPARSRSGDRNLSGVPDTGEGDKGDHVSAKRSTRSNGAQDSRHSSFDKAWDESRMKSNNIGSPTRNKIPRARHSSMGGINRSFENMLNEFDSDRNTSTGDVDLKSIGTKDSHTSNTGEKPKKTKLQKIFELQAKCDRYKQEWLDTSKDKKRLRSEVQDGKVEILRLTKEIEIHTSETSILQNKLSETLQTLDKVQNLQRTERNEFSVTAKELAESRIEFTKALNESRELKSNLEEVRDKLKTRDGQIEDLEEELKKSKIHIENMDLDLNFAEETVLRLEQDMKLLEEEQHAYRKVSEDTEKGLSNSESIQKVRDDAEKRAIEDRDRRMEEKQKKLEVKIQMLEEERRDLLEKEKEQQEDFERRLEDELARARNDAPKGHQNYDLSKVETLEYDNKALQGRLKAEQLDSQMKLREKEELIESMRKELEHLQSQIAQSGSDPNGAEFLKKELETTQSVSTRLKEELEEIQTHNKMLSEKIVDLEEGTGQLKAQVKDLQNQVNIHRKEAENWQQKSIEWEGKSGEWTNKAHLWKDKAEHWEKIAKESDSNASPNSDDGGADPQALFLQAALDRKKALTSTKDEGSKWNVVGNFWSSNRRTQSSDDAESNERFLELERENSEQEDLIKKLRSELLQSQSSYKEKEYMMEQKIKELTEEQEVLCAKNESLSKELELARKLENCSSQAEF